MTFLLLTGLGIWAGFMVEKWIRTASLSRGVHILALVVVWFVGVFLFNVLYAVGGISLDFTIADHHRRVVEGGYALGMLINFLGGAHPVTESSTAFDADDSALYAVVAEEIKNGDKDEGLWLKARVEAEKRGIDLEICYAELRVAHLRKFRDHDLSKGFSESETPVLRDLPANSQKSLGTNPRPRRGFPRDLPVNSEKSLGSGWSPAHFVVIYPILILLFAFGTCR